ncbi:MAG: translocation/assembly module TamB, partial [Bdellovibrionales bacterium]|nr:translocation/assembly module TamB [Bdellovibrionales bacterium]
AATVDFETQAKDLWISDFGLGTTKTQGGYKAGTLSFGNIEGTYRSSRYKGGVQVLLNDSRIQGAVSSQLLELNDLQRLLARKAELPIVAVGLGRAEAKFEGPLDFSKLSYTLFSSFQSGTINEESFQEIHFDVVSQNGNVKTQRAIVKKGRGLLQMKAEVNPDAILEAEIKSTDLTMQDFQSMADLGLNVTGALISEMTLNGHILHPQFRMRNRLTDTYIGDQPVSDSEISILWNPDLISTEVRLLGKSLVSRFTIPQSGKIPFQFHISTEKFNFAPLFGLLRNNGESKDFQGLLTMKGDLKSDPGGTFWNSRGQIQISEFELKQGRIALNSPTPLDLTFSGQQVSSNAWTLLGDQTDLKLRINPSTEQNLDFNVQGKLELALISFLTPFLDDLRGVLSGAATFKGSFSNPNWLGSFHLQQGYIRLRDFPHAFENLSADLALNKNLVTISTLEAQLGGGKLTGIGKVELVHLNELPLDIKGNLEAVSLNVPAGVQTTGDGDYHLTGSWFPFTLQGNYRIRDGIMTKNLDAEETHSTASKRRSSLLPQFLSAKDVDPLNFNLNVSFPQGYKIKNNLVDLIATGDLQVRGTNVNPVMSGEVNLKKGGKLFFRETPFDIQVGSLKFNDPKENNPFVYLTGTTRVNQNVTGKNSFYDLSMLAQGSSKNLSIQLRSQPPLSEQDIISLLALGVTTNDLQNQGYSKTQSDQLNILEKQQSLELGSAILSQNPVGKEIKKRTGFDVKLSSAVDQIANDALPRIVVSRQWNPKV